MIDPDRLEKALPQLIQRSGWQGPTVEGDAGVDPQLQGEWQTLLDQPVPRSVWPPAWIAAVFLVALLGPGILWLTPKTPVPQITEVPSKAKTLEPAPTAPKENAPPPPPAALAPSAPEPIPPKNLSSPARTTKQENKVLPQRRDGDQGFGSGKDSGIVLSTDANPALPKPDKALQPSRPIWKSEPLKKEEAALTKDQHARSVSDALQLVPSQPFKDSMDQGPVSPAVGTLSGTLAPPSPTVPEAEAESLDLLNEMVTVTHPYLRALRRAIQINFPSEGTETVIGFTLTPQGRLESIKILQSGGGALDRATLEALQTLDLAKLGDLPSREPLQFRLEVTAQEQRIKVLLADRQELK